MPSQAATWDEIRLIFGFTWNLISLHSNSSVQLKLKVSSYVLDKSFVWPAACCFDLCNKSIAFHRLLPPSNCCALLNSNEAFNRQKWQHSKVLFQCLFLAAVPLEIIPFYANWAVVFTWNFRGFGWMCEDSQVGRHFAFCLERRSIVRPWPKWNKKTRGPGLKIAH